jgi:hypothetical protein
MNYYEDSLLTLGIEKFEINWLRKFEAQDFSKLFLPKDKKIISYYIYGDNDTLQIKEDIGFSAPLSIIDKRLNLLGYSNENIGFLFVEHKKELKEHSFDVPMDFNAYKNFIFSIDLDKVTIDINRFVDWNIGEYFSRYLIKDPEIKKWLPKAILSDFYFGVFYDNLDPLITLKILANEKHNENRILEWRYKEQFTDYDFFTEESSYLSEDDKIIIITEGSSDTTIIQKAIEYLKPEISDFFTFIKMDNKYKSKGVGKQFALLHGLIKLNSKQKILFIFDNDTAGVEMYEQSKKLDKMKNICICKLPDHNSFGSFKTKTENGYNFNNINGTAVAIENFLDFNSIEEDTFATEKGYNSKMKNYQGELSTKKLLSKKFYKTDLDKEQYNTEKLEYLVDYLIKKWTEH